MTDWDAIVNHIQSAMQAVDKAHAALETLQEKADKEEAKRFQLKMKKLQKRLEQMQNILTHEDIYAMDELAGVLGAALGSNQTYHRIADYEVRHR